MSSYEAPVSPVDSDKAVASAIGVVAAIVILIVIFFIGQLTINHFRNPGRFPIRTVVVEGVYQYTDQGQLRNRVMSQAERGFFNLDIATIQKEVEGLPWVEKAYVRRVWPESISVHVEEHSAVARWGRDGLVSDNFKLFFPPQMASANDANLNEHVSQLPYLYSPERRHAALLNLLMETQPLLKAIEAPITGITEDERRSITLMLDGDVHVIIGHRFIAERIQRFADIFRSYVAPVYDDVERVDMRYTNGFTMARKSVSSNSTRAE